MNLVDSTTRNYKIEFEMKDEEEIDLEIGNLLNQTLVKRNKHYLQTHFLLLVQTFPTLKA
jgi:hypothetical protein